MNEQYLQPHNSLLIYSHVYQPSTHEKKITARDNAGISCTSIFQISFLDFILSMLTDIFSIPINGLSGIVDYVESAGLYKFLAFDYYINLRDFWVLSSLIALFWFYLKYSSYLKTLESLEQKV